MVGEELQRNDGEDRADEVGDARDGYDVVGDAVQLFRAVTGGDGGSQGISVSRASKSKKE